MASVEDTGEQAPEGAPIATMPYFSFLELATRTHMSKVMDLEPVMLATLLQSIGKGLLSFESRVVMQCCSSVDNVVRYFHQQ